MNNKSAHSPAILAEEGLVIPLIKGPFQNNGASPWYAGLGVGNPAQRLKFSFDTGSNFNWVTSSLCGTEGCIHYGGEQFNVSLSETFKWVNQECITVDFGPWGEMQVETGHDDIILESDAAPAAIPSDLYLSQAYTGTQFAELDWDGGIGLPSYSYQPVADTAPQKAYRGNHDERQADFHFMHSLLRQGIISAANPYVSFATDPLTKQGQAVFGKLDPDYADSREYLFLPWDRYAANDAVASLYYIWTTPLASMSIGEHSLCQAENSHQYWFCLDSGSSQFKGDPDIMFNAYQRASLLGEDVTIRTPQNSYSSEGSLVIPASLYNVHIDAGEFEGKQVPQFEPMQGLDNLVLVGSVLMDSLYTVYEYRVNADSRLEPVGMWIFNKKGGPRIIQTTQEAKAAIFDESSSSNALTLNGR
ncbi:peptidase A24 [Vibrio albus]|uniref:Peptidase A24 n=1 Tax=Vibrio albus TaxID=2200953 RepID=A0A2U3B762_9VIBR|nr:pepsin-like aspartic protease [Vibrio albus]PWI32564.1 peptidase A24 [Vibrio albus]